MLLFPDINKVKKFFDLLIKKERHTLDRYNGVCGKEVFVRRTINKWLAGKHLIYYAENKETGIEYKRYLFISRLKFMLNWGISDLELHSFDYCQPQNGIISEKITHNDIISAEGIWCDDAKDHINFVKKILINDPIKDFICKTYTPSKRGKMKEGKIIIQAKTLREANNKKIKFLKENKGILLGNVI